MKLDLGKVLSVLAAAIHTSYYAGSTSAVFNGGRSDHMRTILDTKTIGGTAITSVQLTVLGSADGVTFEAIETTDDTSTAGQPKTEQTWTIGAAGTEQQNSCNFDGGFPYYKVEVKATGGAGQALESMTVYAEAY